MNAYGATPLLPSPKEYQMPEFKSSTHLKIAWSVVWTAAGTLVIFGLTVYNASKYGLMDGYTLSGALFTLVLIVFTAAARTNVRDRAKWRRTPKELRLF